MCSFSYFVICHPMKAQYVSTPRRARVIVAVLWPLAFAVASPIAFYVVCTSSA